jgi:hypothetical protein
MESTDQQPINTYGDINLIKETDDVMKLIRETLEKLPSDTEINYRIRPICCDSYRIRPITANSYFGKYNNNPPSKD